MLSPCHVHCNQSSVKSMVSTAEDLVTDFVWPDRCGLDLLLGECAWLLADSIAGNTTDCCPWRVAASVIT